MAEDVRRAHDEVRRVVESRPEATSTEPALSRGLLRRDLGLTVAAGVLDLLVGAAALALGPDWWITTAAGVGVGVTGANAILERFQEAGRRVRGSARILEHGPDPADTLAALLAGAPAQRWRLVVWAVLQSVLVGLVAVVVLGAWSTGLLAQVTAVAALACRLAAAWSAHRYGTRRLRWLPDFLRAEGITPPPLPDRWRALVPR